LGNGILSIGIDSFTARNEIITFGNGILYFGMTYSLFGTAYYQSG
jgi:hypothetical protein